MIHMIWGPFVCMRSSPKSLYFIYISLVPGALPVIFNKYEGLEKERGGSQSPIRQVASYMPQYTGQTIKFGSLLQQCC